MIKFIQPTDGYKAGEIADLNRSYELMYVQRNVAVYCEDKPEPVKKKVTRKAKVEVEVNAHVEGADE